MQQSSFESERQTFRFLLGLAQQRKQVYITCHICSCQVGYILTMDRNVQDFSTIFCDNLAPISGPFLLAISLEASPGAIFMNVS